GALDSFLVDGEADGSHAVVEAAVDDVAGVDASRHLALLVEVQVDPGTDGVGRPDLEGAPGSPAPQGQLRPTVPFGKAAFAAARAASEPDCQDHGGYGPGPA